MEQNSVLKVINISNEKRGKDIGFNSLVQHLPNYIKDPERAKFDDG